MYYINYVTDVTYKLIQYLKNNNVTIFYNNIDTLLATNSTVSAKIINSIKQRDSNIIHYTVKSTCITWCSNHFNFDTLIYIIYIIYSIMPRIHVSEYDTIEWLFNIFLYQTTVCIYERLNCIFSGDIDMLNKYLDQVNI